MKSSGYDLKVGVDMHVVDGMYQGTRTYLVELFSRVIASCHNIQFHLFCSNANNILNIASAFSSSNVVVVSGISKNPIFRLAVQFPILSKRYELDYLHVQYVLPLFLGNKGVVSLHDILFESSPEFFGKLFVLRSRLLMRWSAQRANKIFTVSAFSKDDISSRYRIRKEKIDLVYCGVDTRRFFPGSGGQELVASRGLVSKSYLLTVGRIDPRKNLVGLVQAYDLTNKDVPLVIVGQDGLRSHELYREIEERGLCQNVIVFKDVGDDELLALYRHAQIFVFPSFSEGFGLPVLEAMASGVPTIVSNTTSLPEVAGEAAVLVDPKNVNQLAEALSLLMSSLDLRSSLIKKGIIQAQKFNWESSANLISQFYLSKISKG
ncbi:glycosyltransferase family 4 protein [Gammaproteobacteria bacterium]|nr:glycosyltransferase family 4 protein [Gammaproteobacteria bacterium]